MPPKKTSNAKRIVKTFNQELHDWIDNDELEDHEDEIIDFLLDKNNNFNELNYKDLPVIYWAARFNYIRVLEEALKRDEASGIINNFSTISANQYKTPLCAAAYFGHYEAVELLAKNDALFEVTEIINNQSIACNVYEFLGKGYFRWPKDERDYRKTLKNLYDEDPQKINRKFFSEKYDLTKNRAYLACLHLYDQNLSTMKEKVPPFNYYLTRNLLTVEDTASRRFFRFNQGMHAGGNAEALSANLFSAPGVSISGYAARSVVIALVRRMRGTSPQAVQNAVNHPGNFYNDPNKSIFKAYFNLGLTNFTYDWRPQMWQRGNCIIQVNNKMPQPFGAALSAELEELTDTNPLISNITGKTCNARTQKLGNLLLEKAKNLQSFEAADFTYDNSAQNPNKLKIRTQADIDQGKSIATDVQARTAVHRLNELLVFWVIMEPARRLSGHQPSHFPANKQDKKAVIKLDHIPVATMQIRALQLLAEGIIPIRDIFGKSAKYNNPDHNAEYGVSTGKMLSDNFDLVKEKAENLSKIGLPHATLATELSLFSRMYTKQILREGYGFADESDNEDYSDNDLPPNPFI